MLMTVSASRKFENFSTWFDDLIIRARIADNRFPVKGFIVYMETVSYTHLTLPTKRIV